MNKLNIGDIFKQLNFLLGKNQYGKTVTPLYFNDQLKWLPAALTDFYIEDFEESRGVSTNIRHLLKTCGSPEIPKLSVDSFGRVILPEDFYYPSSGYSSTFLNGCGNYTEEQNNIEFVDDATFAGRMSSQMRFPTTEYPIAKYTTKYDSGQGYIPAILIAPRGIDKISLTYLRQIETPVFAYTLSGSTVIYNPALSVQLEFPDSAYDKAVEILAQKFSSNLHSQEDMQNSMIRDNQQGT